MKKDAVMETIKKIVEDCGLNEIISVSLKENEIADFHIIDDSLGFCGKKLIYFDCIEHIFYTEGEGKEYSYPNSFFQLYIQLDGDIHLLFEYGDEWVCWINNKRTNKVIIDHFSDSENEFYRFLNTYNLEAIVRQEIIDNLNTLESYNDDFDLESAKIWKNEAYKYMESHCDDNNNEIYFAIVDAAWNYWNIKQDVFCLKELVDKLIKEDKVYLYLQHIRSAWVNIIDNTDIKKWVNGILQIKQEIEDSPEN